MERRKRRQRRVHDTHPDVVILAEHLEEEGEDVVRAVGVERAETRVHARHPVDQLPGLLDVAGHVRVDRAVGRLHREHPHLAHHEREHERPPGDHENVARNARRRPHAQWSSGRFSPAVTPTVSQFSRGTRGQLAQGVNAQGGV